MACTRCGNCCTYASIKLFPKPDTLTENTVSLKKWLSLHGLKIIEKGNEFEVYIPNRCRNLRVVGDKTECIDYENRPIECRNYVCDSARVKT